MLVLGTRLLTIKDCLAFLLILSAVACANPQPANQTTSVLYRDLQRLVSLENSKGWGIDRIEVDELLPQALLSICAIPSDSRNELSTWLLAEEKAYGGLPAEVYKARGKDLGAMSKLLELHRIRILLDHALTQTERDCPFWIEPSKDFLGLHLVDKQWILSVGGGGKLIGVKQQENYDVNFGGAGRVLLGKGFSRNWAILGGFELGGGAGFPRDASGERGNLTILVDMVVQANLRYQIVNSYFELEGGYLTQTTEADLTEFLHGYRVGIAYGLQYSRQLLFLPGASFGISYDHIYGNESTSISAQYLKVGFRGVFDLTL